MTSLRTLARFVAESRLQDVSEPVQDEAVRGLVDWLGCALGGCLEPEVADALAGSDAAFASPQATLPGQGERATAAAVAYASATAAATLDFGAVHATTGAAVTRPLAAALFALAEARAANGAALLHAFVLGAEIGCRLARAPDVDGAVSTAPDFPAAIAAAAACGKLLGLDEQRLADAMARAVAAGERNDAGTHVPDLEALAAHNAVAAALAAESASPDAEASPRLAHPASDTLAAAGVRLAALDGLGTEWHLHEIAYKAYPCARALHGAIEACLGARSRLRPLLRQLDCVELRVHPQALHHDADAPATVAQARRSLRHVAALALLDGTLGPEQLEASRLASPRVAEMRARIAPIADPAAATDAAHATIRMSDGRSAEHGVRCARGGPARPLGDAELSDKFRSLACRVLASSQAERVLALAWNIRALGDVGALVRASLPEDVLEPAELPGSPLIPR